MNLPTIIGTLIIAGIVVSIIIRGIRNHKKGDGGCGGGCNACPHSSQCHH